VADPCPFAVPFPEPVPNSEPSEKVCVSFASVMRMVGGLVKSTVDIDVAVKAPNNVSVPSPAKFWMKMPGVLVGVSVPTPSNDPDMDWGKRRGYEPRHGYEE